MRSLILLSLVAASLVGPASAEEAKPQPPKQLVLDFQIGTHTYSVKVVSAGSAKTVAILCDGAVIAEPLLDELPQWRVAGAVIGAELSADSQTACTGHLNLGLITRDFSSNGGETLARYDLGVAGAEIVTFGRSTLRE